MPSSHCVFNPATALRRVFMPTNAGSSHSLHLTRIFVPALLALPPQARAYWAVRDSGASQAPPRPTPSIFDRDSYVRTASGNNFHNRRAGRPNQKKEVDPDAPGPRVAAKLGRMPRDNEINWPYVYVKTPGVEGWEALDTPRPIKEVLAELDRKTTYLEAIAVPKADEVGSPRWPVCRIVNKKEELAKLKDIKERKKKGATKEKELELNWTLASHDLDHKLKTLQKFLSKGYKVQVLLQRKSRSKATATEEDAKALIEKVTKVIEEVKGAKEWKRREGKVLGSYRIFLHGKVQDETAPASVDVAKETPTTSSDTAEGTPTGTSYAAEESPITDSDVAEESDGSSRGHQSQS
ncbi:putative translation initiation factor [Diaporthe ampelina]|uniref:Putative translation initiation factor n=1 Tax=Diaporthe ampelina TaxID=1214573 RepID=A0A0G2FPJ4_9PEZI|nr:putative translation initiation factor [Diaporthe ampelina]